jgi:hypothetical protein
MDEPAAPASERADGIAGVGVMDNPAAPLRHGQQRKIATNGVT